MSSKVHNSDTELDKECNDIVIVQLRNEDVMFEVYAPTLFSSKILDVGNDLKKL